MSELLEKEEKEMTTTTTTTKLTQQQEKGLEAHEYFSELCVEEKYRDYQCMICMCLIKKATQIQSCGHFFCKDCIKPWYEQNESCPLCKTEIKKGDMTEIKHIDRKVGEIKVQCPCCPWQGFYLDFEKHLSPSANKPCPYLLAECLACHEKIKVEHMESHKTEKCQYRPVSCEFCQVVIVHNQKDLHLVQDCSETIVSCNELCSFKGTRSLREVHKTLCDYEKIPCPLSYMGCTEFILRKEVDLHMENALQSHFLIAEEKIKNVMIENKNLKTKLLNYEPIPHSHSFMIGDFLRYGDKFCTIKEIEGNWLILIDDFDGEVKISRFSDRLHLLE
jgi:hypothetical protein